MEHEHTTRTVVLRDERDGTEIRYAAATLQGNGDLLIEGQDLGQSVAAFFGEGLHEYEWVRLIPCSHVSLFFNALVQNKDHSKPPTDPLMVLSELKHYFSKYPLKDLDLFLKKHGIQHETWPRSGK